MTLSTKNCKKSNISSPEVTDLRIDKSRNGLTLLLSAERSTDGSGGVGVSELERSCMARTGTILPVHKFQIC